MSSELLYTVTPANRDDSEAVWLIRYHPLVNATALHTECVDFEHHDVWFANHYFSGLENRCFVLRQQEKVIGYCRFDQKENYFEISIAIHPDHQGQGLGQKLLAESIILFGRGGITLRAVIKDDNSGSRRLFENNNFRLLEEAGDHLVFQRNMN